MNPESSPLHEAERLIAAGDPDAARALLEEHRERTECAARLRELLLGEGRVAEAEEMAHTLAAGTGAEAEVSRSVLAFGRGDLQAALRHCRAALALDPALSAAHNHAGRALHNLGHAAQALDALRKATELDPGYAEAWHNLGHALRAAGDMENAIAAYRKAVTLAPGYRCALNNLGITLFNTERVNEAQGCYRSLLERDPNHVDALLGTGLCRQLLGRFGHAREAFERAISLAPGNPLGHLYLGILLNEMSDSSGAIASLERALRLDPSDPEAWVELAGVLEQSNRLEEAQLAIGKGLAAAPGHPGLLIETARLERRAGQAAQAAQRLRTIDPRALPARMRQQLFFELGFALDRAGEPDAAIQAFETGNRLAAGSVRSRAVDRDAFARRCAALESWVGRGAPGSAAMPGDPRDDQGPDLCFLVGFPRSGTTLVDTSLATLEEVAAIEEAATLDVVIRTLERHADGYPGALGSLGGAALGPLRAAYREAVRPYLAEKAATRVVDKMPLRFMHAGLVARLFPEARLLFVLRHPCDVVLSNFMQPFAVNETNIHFDTLEHCAHMYDRIMRLWQDLEQRIELPVEYVRYEALVTDTRGSLERVCDFLGLEAGRLDLGARARLDTRERVRTSSYQQVGEPIYSRAAGRWNRYRRHLEPHLELLKPHVERYGYSLGD